MKYGLILLCLLIKDPLCSEMDELRYEFHQISSEDTLDSFIQKAEAMDCPDKTPYLGSAIMRKAEFTIWPNKKLHYFHSGKKILEAFISEFPENLEARYVRLLAQSSIPGFLNYHDEMKNDKQFILNKIHSTDLPEDYKEFIILKVNNLKIKQ